MEKTYTVKQVADILSYSTNSVYTFLKEGRIKGVRIGKGRFRISQEELEKLLHLKKIKTDNFEQQITQTTKLPAEKEIPSLNRHLEEIKENVPSLFDWFISLVSIILGFTMILFVRNFEEFSGTTFSQFFLPIKINLLAAGLGLFAVNFVGQARKKWFSVFYLIILVNFIVYALILLSGKDFLGSFFFILSSIIIVLHLILSIKGTVSFNILISVLTVCSPLMLIIFPKAIDLSEFTKVTGLSTNTIILIWSIIVLVINVFIWVFDKKKKLPYWISFFIISLGFGYFSYLYSIQQYWSRTLIYILIALFILISSFWNEIIHSDKENRRILKNLFCDIALIYIVLVSIIWIIQSNARTFTQDELVNKLITGQDFIKSNINSSQEKLETLSKSRSLIDTIEKNDQVAIKDDIKNIFILSNSFRRILLADKNGDLLGVYPDTNINYSNIAFREGFKDVLVTKTTNLSNLFQSQEDDTKKFTVSINVPIFNENKDIIGILIGSLDIDFMANKLRQITNNDDKESFLMIDQQGNLILQTDNLSKLSSEEVSQLKTNNNIQAEEVSDFENKILQVHNKIDDTNWTIAIRKPLINIYSSENNTNLLLCIMMLGAGLLMIFLNLIHLNK
jgi:excisionase family DNA binding protein